MAIELYRVIRNYIDKGGGDCTYYMQIRYTMCTLNGISRKGSNK